VVCWGKDSKEQCYVPRHLADVISVCSGRNRTVALTREGEIVCWGDNEYYQLCSMPDIPEKPTAISVARSHTIALMENGKVVQWGAHPVVPATLENVVAVSAGGTRSVAVLADGSVMCWGRDTSDQCEVPHELVVMICGNILL
jgi:alpha-tubulin suppressor-like RCC1 family protein